MGKSKQVQEDDDSWEVRAFAEDTANAMDTTWPPRSYTCTFCGREFRSAQALGGHMNIHRRVRARLQQAQPAGSSINPSLSAISTSSSSPFLIPTQEFSTNCGLSLLYQLPKPGGVFTPTNVNACAIESPSTLLSISPCPTDGLTGKSLTFSVEPPLEKSFSPCYSSKVEPALSADNSSSITNFKINTNCKELANEELDLELRLGHGPTTSSS